MYRTQAEFDAWLKSKKSEYSLLYLNQEALAGDILILREVPSFSVRIEKEMLPKGEEGRFAHCYKVEVLAGR